MTNLFTNSGLCFLGTTPSPTSGPLFGRWTSLEPGQGFQCTMGRFIWLEALMVHIDWGVLKCMTLTKTAGLSLATCWWGELDVGQPLYEGEGRGIALHSSCQTDYPLCCQPLISVSGHQCDSFCDTFFIHLFGTYVVIYF